VIGKVCKRGSDVRRLLGYLFRDGLAGEHGLSAPHADAHLVAAWDGIGDLEPARLVGGGRELSALAALLTAPLLAAGLERAEWKQARPVYHLAISAAEVDRRLSDQEWAEVAVEYVDRIGLAPRGDEDPVRWVAVRHADNHVHVVATLARQDGKRVWPRNDFYRAREASLAVEARYGLTATSPADRTADPETSRAEQRRHVEQNQQRTALGAPTTAAPDREVLRSKVRVALSGTDSFAEFSERLSLDGVLVRPRMSVRDPSEVTGYAVALRPRGGDAAEGVEPVWFGGGKLAPDLTFPQLQARWRQEAGPACPRPREGGPTPGLISSPEERSRLWLAAHRAVFEADEQLRAACSGDPRAMAGAQASATTASEVLAAVGRLTERTGTGPLRQAADAYDRAARGLRRHVPVQTGHARRTRLAAGGLLGMQFVRRADTRQLLELLDRLGRLSVTLAGLREQQGRGAQAAAGRRAAEMLAAEYARRSAVALSAAPGRGRTPAYEASHGSARSAPPVAQPWHAPRMTPARRPSR